MIRVCRKRPALFCYPNGSLLELFKRRFADAEHHPAICIAEAEAAAIHEVHAPTGGAGFRFLLHLCAVLCGDFFELFDPLVASGFAHRRDERDGRAIVSGSYRKGRLTKAEVRQDRLERCGAFSALSPEIIGQLAQRLGAELSRFLLHPDRFELFEKEVSQYPEVMECLLITGQSADYQLKVVVADMETYQEFLLNKITRIQGVSDVHSSFILREVINSTELPLEHL